MLFIMMSLDNDSSGEMDEDEIYDMNMNSNTTKINA